ncbi:unnamed protein product [Somion occarium]|uniref:Glycogen [starch] synthase n=1 Tax=Somion occarium TaxID=3059160 RepID=A0ABP1D3I7_9APHY
MSENKRDVKNSLLFECAWEVANKVGGIYTVIKTKVPVTVSEYGDRYCLIGPLSYKTAPMEVEQQEPKDPHLASTLESMRNVGVKALYGRWLIEGAPHVLLFDTGSQYSRLDEWKGDLWNLAGIPTPPNDHETNETIVFGYIVAWFLGEYVARQLGTAVVAHFHEWQAGLAIPLLRKRHVDVTTVFTTHFFTAGRYEYRNKGVDMFIEALARLNYRLKRSNSKTTVVAFIIMPAATHSYTIEALKGQAVVKQLRDTVSEIQNRLGTRLFEHAIRSNGDHATLPAPEKFLSEEDKVLLKRRIFALKRNALPPITTHNMADDANDPILNQIRRVQLFNSEADRVKIVFHPDFLNSSNPILGLDYEEFVRGCHLGVFPSYYEPWGYTPAECTVMGIPSITTNLSGFGCFMQDLIERPQDEGCYIVDRRSQSVEDTVNQLTDNMFTFSNKTRRQRINQRNRVERLSPLLDWKNLGIEYSKARQLALRRAYPDSFYGVSGLEGEDEEFDFGMERMMPNSVPASPRFRMSGIATPGDIGTLTEEMQALGTSDYRGQAWGLTEEDEEEGYPFPLVMKVRSRASSVVSGASTPGGGRSKSLSEVDLRKADAALSHNNTKTWNNQQGF